MKPITFILSCVIFYLIVPKITAQESRVLFNQSVDKRYAWLGNDAEVANFQNEIINIINGATAHVEVSTMTFSKVEIANALVAKANSGVPVRIIGNAGHRLTQDGWKIALQAHNIDMVDNNLPALVHRINFQAEVASPPDGWSADRGELFGPHGTSNYGWLTNQTSRMRNAGTYTSSLLDDCFAVNNSDGTQTWEIEVPNGPYYVAFVTGRPDAATRTYLKFENQNVINSGAFTFASKPVGQYWGEAVDGGIEIVPGEDPSPNAVRILVNDNRLTMTIGDNTAPGGTNSAICFLEIYRGDEEANGDTSYEDGVDNTIQNRQTMHSKYIIADAGLPGQKIWISSGNLTQGMDAASGLSEDAIISTNASLISTYFNMFNQMWGAVSGRPLPNVSNFGTYKSGTSSDLTVDGKLWQMRYSPSVGAIDISDNVSNYITTSSNDLTLIMEQFKSTGDIRGYDGTNQVVDAIVSKLGASYKLRGLIGATDGITSTTFDPAFSTIRTPTGAVGEMRIHNKYALTNTIRDSRTTLQGKVLAGSMNWTQSALHFNDEQTMIIHDPFIANKYLQHAMKRLGERGIAPNFTTDIMLIMDRSFSMNDASIVPGVSKMEAAKQAGNLFLDIINVDGNHKVGITRFGNAIEPFSPPITLSNYTLTQQTNCHNGINATFATLPIGSATCYNVALADAISQFDGVSPNERRLIHFFTDGKENCAINSNTFYSTLQDKKIEVHCTGFGDGTDMAASLEGLSQATGGTYAQVDLNPVSLNKRFAEVARNAMQLSTVLDPQYKIRAKKSIKERFVLDESTTQFKVIISWNHGLEKPIKDWILISPDGIKLNAISREVITLNGKTYSVIHVKKDKTFRMGGQWTFGLTRSSNNPNITMTADIIIFADGDIFFKAEAIDIDRNSNLLLARMLHNNEAVKNLKITASITSPITKEYAIGRTEIINLTDDGRNGDKIKSDGLYSSIMKMRENGSHKVHIIATGTIKIEGKEFEIRREYLLYPSIGKQK